MVDLNWPFNAIEAGVVAFVGLSLIVVAGLSVKAGKTWTLAGVLSLQVEIDRNKNPESFASHVIMYCILGIALLLAAASIAGLPVLKCARITLHSIAGLMTQGLRIFGW